MQSPWALNRLLLKFNHRHNFSSTHAVNKGQNKNINNTRPNNKSFSIVVPYTKGLSKRFKKTCNTLGIPVHFKGSNTIYTLLMAPKDKENMSKKWVVYWFKCPPQGLPPRIHRGIREGLWAQTEGVSLSPIPYPSTQPENRTSC